MTATDMFRPRLDSMIDLRHPLAVLANQMPWNQIESALAPFFVRRNRTGRIIQGVDLFGPSMALVGAGVSPAGRPRLSIRLMASLLYLKHAFNLSDTDTVERWSENVIWKYFSGNDYYEPRLPCDPGQIGRFRKGIGEAGVEELLRATIATAIRTKCVLPTETQRIIVDIKLQEKAVAFPTESQLLEIARAKLVKATRLLGLKLKQTIAEEGKDLRHQAVGPIIGHLKADQRIARCWLKGAAGDALNTVLAAVGFNLRWLLRALVRLFFVLFNFAGPWALISVTMSRNSYKIGQRWTSIQFSPA